MSVKEKLIARLNNGFGLEIDPKTEWRCRMNPRGLLDRWQFAFIPLIPTPFGNVPIGSYQSAGELLKAERLIIERDSCGDYSIWGVASDYQPTSKGTWVEDL